MGGRKQLYEGKLRNDYQKENIWAEHSVKKASIKLEEHRGMSLQIFGLVVEGDTMLRS